MQQDLGIPVRRSRTYGVCLRKATMVWLGPTGDITELFLKIFGASVETNGDIFIAADTPENIQKVRQDMAALRGFRENIARLPFRHLFSPLAQERLQELHTKFLSSGLEVFVGDVSQFANRVRGGEFIPTLARSTTLISVSKEHLFTPAELDLTMGWPCVPELHACGRYSDLLPDVPEVSSTSTSRRLNGNGMHLAQVGSWVLFILSYAMRRDIAVALLPPTRVL